MSGSSNSPPPGTGASQDFYHFPEPSSGMVAVPHPQPAGPPGGPESLRMKRQRPDEDEDEDEDEDDEEGGKRSSKRTTRIAYISDRSRRHTTFSKRKAGLIKKAYELTTLTGTQALLLIASESGHVYSFATPKLLPFVTLEEGKQLIQECLTLDTPDLHSSDEDSLDHHHNTDFDPK
ncbi:MAG: MADS-box domain-containing protein [archaeon]|nr:MADS-box domain-containing protein [archaeon]